MIESIQCKSILDIHLKYLTLTKYENSKGFETSVNKFIFVWGIY